MFWYNQLMVCTHRDQARVGTISSKVEHYLEWKDAYPLRQEQIAAACNGNSLDGISSDMPAFDFAGNSVGVAEQQIPYKVGLKTPVVANSQQILLAGLSSHANFLDVIQNFTLHEPVDGRVVKKIARYQQFRVVHKTTHRLKTGATKKDKGGIIWHTKGSGKSLTMVMPVSSKEFVSGEAFPYLGRNYRLKIAAGAFQPVKPKQG